MGNCDLFHYSSGVYNDRSCYGSPLNHAVNIVGYVRDAASRLDYTGSSAIFIGAPYRVKPVTCSSSAESTSATLKSTSTASLLVILTYFHAFIHYLASMKISYWDYRSNEF